MPGHNKLYVGRHRLTLLDGPSFLFSALFSVPVGALSLAPFTVSRSTPGFVDISPGGDYSVMQLQGPNTPRLESRGLMVENAKANALAYSQLIGFFDGSVGWQPLTLAASAPTITLNSADLLAPDGTQTASKIVCPAVGAGGRSTTFQNGGQAANSVWMRTLSGTATVTLNDGTPTGVVCSLTATWQRFTYTTGNGNLLIGLDGAVSGALGGATFYAWGAQSEAAFVTSYFPTGTQLVASSQLFTAAAWAQSAGVHSSVDNALAPDGTNTGNLLTVDGNNAQHIIYNTVTVPALGAAVQTIYAKAGTVNFLGVAWGNGATHTVVVDLSNGNTSNLANATVTVSAAPNGWTKIDLAFSIATSQTFYILAPADTAANAATCLTGGAWSAAGTETVHVWGAQCGYGTQPAAYLQTGATITTTRALDVVTLPNPLSGLNPANWSYGALLTPLDTWNNIQSQGGGAALFVQFGSQVAANSMRGLVAAGPNLQFDVWDNAAAVQTLGGIPAVSGSAPASISYFNKAGAQTSSPGGGSISGAGTGVITTQPATITLGLGSSIFNFQGWIRNIFVDNK